MSRKTNVRFDRIVTSVVILILVIYGGIQLFNVLFKKNNTSDNNQKPEFSPVIYLSPSNEKESMFADGNISEAEAMTKICENAENYLREKGVTVYISSPETSLKEKVSFANENKVTACVAVHSNAGIDGKGEGTACFYNSEVPGSRKLSEYVYTRVSRSTPAEDRGMADGKNGRTYMFETAEVLVPSCLLEIEYHNTIEQSRWILENTEVLGKAVADGILEYVEYAENEYNRKNSEGNNGE